MDLIIHFENAVGRQTHVSPACTVTSALCALYLVKKLLSHNGDRRDYPPNYYHHCGKKLGNTPMFLYSHMNKSSRVLWCQ